MATQEDGQHIQYLSPDSFLNQPRPPMSTEEPLTPPPPPPTEAQPLASLLIEDQDNAAKPAAAMTTTDHSLLLLDPQELELGAEVSGALVAAQLAVLPSGSLEPAAHATTHLSFQALNENIMDALGAAVGGAKGAGVGVALDPSAWPIVHGSRGSQDRADWRQPRGDPNQRYYLFSSQSVQEEEEANALYMGHLLMQNLGAPADKAAGSSNAKDGGEGQGFFDEAGALIDFKVSDANAVSVITERVSDTETRLWTSTIGNVVVYRQLLGASGLQRLATFDHGRNTRFHGSYAFVASNGTENGFFTTMEDKVARFVLRGSDAAGWRILQTGEQALPATRKAEKEEHDHLVGLTVLDDGTVVAGSKNGVLMAVRLDPEGDFLLQDALRVEDHTASGIPALVSNSLSSAGQAVFLATHRELIRVDLDPATRRFSLKWAAQYHDRDMPWYVGRLGFGSGSTPSVTECGGRQLVVITDGALPMSVLWYDATTGAVIGRRTVQFAEEENGDAPTTSEQSVAVAGCRAFVVNNYLGSDDLDPAVTCASAPRQSSALRRRLGLLCQQRLDPQNPADLFPVRTCPVVLGCSAFGAALYEVTPPPAPAEAAEAEEWPARRVWTRDDVSCGTSIPLISTHPESPIVYCAGLRQGSHQWALLGMDLATGGDRAYLQFYERNLALNALANPFYAGVEATGEDTVTLGSAGGVLHISPEPDPAAVVGGGGEKSRAEGSGKWAGIFFSSGPPSALPAREAGVAMGKDSSTAMEKAGLRLLEDRTGAVAASASSWGHRMRRVGDTLGQEALAAAVVVLGGLIVLIVMRLRRAGPWSPRMPR